MEGENLKTEDKTKSEEIHRVIVTRQAEEALECAVNRVNDGFEGGRVNRFQVANWLILRGCDSLSDSEIREIRSEHFDEVSVLESILKRARKTGEVPAEIRVLLQKQFGLEDSTKKKTKKNLPDM